MSSIELHRNAELNTKRSQLLTAEIKRKGLIEELCRTTYVYNNPALVLQYGFDAPTIDEVRVLDENDISKGRYFDDSTIPALIQNVKSQSQSLKQPARSPSPRRNTSARPPEVVVDATKASSIVDPAVAATQSLPSPTASDPQATDETEMARLAKQRQQAPRLDSVSIKETQQPPTPIDLALATDKTSRAPETRTSPERPLVDTQKALPLAQDDLRGVFTSEGPGAPTQKVPKVVHLPPNEVQKAHVKEVEQELEVAKKRDRKEDERLSLSVGLGPLAEAASSPSSTIGAHSTFTPRPEHHSQDTSPDTEMSIDDADNPDSENLISQSILSSTQEQQSRVVRQSKERPGKAGLGPDAGSPDAQLKLEEEQAFRNAQDTTSNVGVQPSDPTGAENRIKDIKAVGNATRSAPRALDSNVSYGTNSKSSDTRRGNQESPTPLKEFERFAESMDANPLRPITREAIDSDDVEMEDVASSKDAAEVVNASDLPMQKTLAAQRPLTPISGALHSSGLSSAESPTFERRPSHRTSLTNSPSRKRKWSQSSPRHPFDQSRLSGIVFAKNLAVTMDPATLCNPGYAALAGAAEEGQRDYLIPLFTYQAHIEQQRGRAQLPEERKFKGQGQPLQTLIAVANKTCSTSNFHVTIRETQENRILKRIYHLQYANRWALRQLERCEEPRPDESLLDHILLQMKAMRTDFREERKLKQAIAADLAYSCAEWHAATLEQRQGLQVKVKKTSVSTKLVSVHHEQLQQISNSQGIDDTLNTPDLIPSGNTETDVESLQDDEVPLLHLSYAEPAAALFTKDFNTTSLDVAGIPSTNDIFGQLPLYEPALVDPPSTKEDIPAVSKYVVSKIVSTATGPPRKRSRYDYEPEERTDDLEYPSKRPSTGTSTSGHATPLTPGFLSRKGGLDPEMTSVALFAPSNRHLLKRLHDTHAFRPPSEFAMPATAFLAARLPSQWTWEEDQKLRQLVKDYSYNWSLVSDELKTRSTLESQADRRTPWECFERWAGLEGLPQEMHKTSYFKTWFSRLDAASALVERAQRLQQNQPGAVNPGNTLQNTNINGIQGRKRHRVPIRIEKKHNSRYIYIMNGIVRRMRKAEALAHKQQENAKAAQMRKNQAHNETGVAGATKTKLAATPQEMSKMRAERDAKMKEKAEQYRQQMELQRQAVHSGQRAGHPPANAAAPQQQRNAVQQNSSQSQSALSNPSNNSANHPQMAQATAATAQLRQSQMAAIQQAMQGMPQGQGQGNMAGQMRGGASSPENLRMAMGHRAMQANGQQNFQQLPHGLSQSNLAAAHMAPANPNVPNQAMLAALSGNVNGTNSGPRPGSSASPRVNQTNIPMGNAQVNMLSHAQNGIGQPQPLSSGVVPMVAQIQHQISTANPQLTPEQVRTMTNERLKSHNAFVQRQQALIAAAGNSGINNNMMPSPSMSSAYSMQQQGGSQSPPGQPGVYHASHVARMNHIIQQQQRQQAQSPAMMQRIPHTSGSPVNIGASPAMSQARPVSRSATPMQRQGSGSGMGMGSPMMGQTGMR